MNALTEIIRLSPEKVHFNMRWLRRNPDDQLRRLKDNVEIFGSEAVPAYLAYLLKLNDAKLLKEALDEYPYDICNCRAFPIYHVVNIPGCYYDQSGPFCGGCGKPCELDTIDVGYGSYEFWGEKGFDSHTVTASKCCNAKLYEDPFLQYESSLHDDLDYGSDPDFGFDD